MTQKQSAQQETTRKVEYTDKISRQYTGSPHSGYLYRIRNTGEVVAVQMAYGEKLDRELPGGFLILPDGQEAQQMLGDQLRQDGMNMGKPSRRAQRPRWPMRSVNAGVNPEQVDELRQFWQEQGVTGCHVFDNGDVEWADRASRKADCKARGLFDRDAGYGDQQPQNV